MKNFLLKTPLGKIPFVQSMLNKYPNPLLCPLVLAPLAMILFFTGFLISLHQIGYFKKIEYSRVDRKPVEERARAELDRFRKLALELGSWGTAMKKKEEALNERDAQLRQAENNLKLEREALEKISKEIQAMKTQLDARILVIDTSQDANIQQLAKLYSSMTAEGAAKLLAPLEVDEIARIIRKMKETRSSKILEIWSSTPGSPLADKATKVTTKMRLAVTPPTEETK